MSGTSPRSDRVHSLHPCRTKGIVSLSLVASKFNRSDQLSRTPTLHHFLSSKDDSSTQAEKLSITDTQVCEPGSMAADTEVCEPGSMAGVNMSQRAADRESPCPAGKVKGALQLSCGIKRYFSRCSGAGTPDCEGSNRPMADEGTPAVHASEGLKHYFSSCSGADCEGPNVAMVDEGGRHVDGHISEGSTAKRLRLDCSPTVDGHTSVCMKVHDPQGYGCPERSLEAIDPSCCERCQECQELVPVWLTDEHSDYHFALRLQAVEQSPLGQDRAASRPATAHSGPIQKFLVKKPY